MLVLAVRPVDTVDEATQVMALYGFNTQQLHGELLHKYMSMEALVCYALSITCVIRAAWWLSSSATTYDLSTLTQHMHAVLSQLYQKKLLTVEDVSVMRKGQYTPDEVVLVQCVKPPEVVAETADVLNTLNCTEEATMLRG